MVESLLRCFGHVRCQVSWKHCAPPHFFGASGAGDVLELTSIMYLVPARGASGPPVGKAAEELGKFR